MTPAQPVQAVSLPKNIIFIVGDGMGLEHIRAGGMYVNGAEGSLVFESFPYKSTMTTNNASGATTDSAASGTAMATGVKVANEVISVRTPGDGADMPTVLEAYKAQGKAIGIVTTSQFRDATPAAFAAHVPDRDNRGLIWADYTTSSQPDVLFGAAGNPGNEVTAAMAATAGYTVVVNRDTMNAVDTSTVTKVCGLFRTNDLYYYEAYRPANRPLAPSLNEMATKALDFLDNDPDGFFLLLENENIDGAGHNSSIPSGFTRSQCLVEEMKVFNETVQTALTWAQTHPDTLIVVTSDHECGNLTVSETAPSAGVVPAMSFGSTGHTSKSVGVYAWGSGASAANFVSDNTHIFGLLLPAVPTVTGHPLNALTRAGGSANFHVTASGTPPFTYQWTKNGVDVPGATESSISVLSVPLSDDGAVYRCRVTNDFGTVLSNAGTLSVEAPPADPHYTFVILPDTQNMVETYPEIWQSICQWIVDNKASRNIQGVLSVGDVTNNNTVAEFAKADAGYDLVDAAGIPYIPIMGNHDYDASSPSGRNATKFDTVFGPARFAGKTWYKGNYQGSNANYYSYLDIGTQHFLVLALEFFPRPGVVTWASGVIDAHPDREVIVLTHCFLHGNGSRVTATTANGPNQYGLPAEDFSGEELWNDLLKAKPNVRAVICGHITHTNHAAYRGDVGDAGNTIHQIFNNYQADVRGGDGWIGLMTFRPTIGTVDLQYYRTYGKSGLMYDPAIPTRSIGWLSTAATAPVITGEPSDAMVTEGFAVEFTVGASGSDPISYQWTRNGADIPGATAATYSATAAMADDNAVYRCRVSNIAGSASTRAATLRVRPNTGLVRVKGGARGFVNAAAGERAQIQFTTEGAGRAHLEIFRSNGERVREMSSDGAGGAQTLEWDGRDDGGEPAGPGVYIFRLKAPGVKNTGKIVLLD